MALLLMLLASFFASSVVAIIVFECLLWIIYASTRSSKVSFSFRGVLVIFNEK